MLYWSKADDIKAEIAMDSNAKTEKISICDTSANEMTETFFHEKVEVGTFFRGDSSRCDWAVAFHEAGKTAPRY